MKGRKTGGRQKGTPNKASRIVVKDEVLAALDRYGRERYFDELIRDHPEIFAKYLLKTMPNVVDATVEHITIEDLVAGVGEDGSDPMDVFSR